MVSSYHIGSTDPQLLCRIRVNGTWAIQQIDPHGEMTGNSSRNLEIFLSYYENVVRHLTWLHYCDFKWEVSQTPGNIKAVCLERHTNCFALTAVYIVITDTDRAHYMALNECRKEMGLLTLAVPPYAVPPSVRTTLQQIGRLITGRPIRLPKPPRAERPMPTPDREAQQDQATSLVKISRRPTRKFKDSPYRS